MKKITFLLTMLLIATISFSQTILLDENFDAATLPTNWGNYFTGNGVQTWTFGSGVTPGGSIADFSTNAAIFDDDGAGDTGNHDMVWLFTPGIDVSTYGQVTLTYDYALNVTAGGETLSVGLWSDGTASFIPIKVYNTDINPTSDTIDITAVLNANPGTFNVNNLIIGFGYDDLGGNWGWGAGIDNVLLTGSIQPVNDSIFVHNATAANSINNYTIIDHPDLNGNPDAKIVVSHNWNPGDVGGVYNNNVTGVWYDGSNWTIYNEDNTVDIVAGSSYNVYIRGNDSNVITHIASAANVGVDPRYTVIDNPIINGDPNAILVMGTYYNPNGIYNNFNYGFYYDGTNWIIYNEATTGAIPTDAAYNIIISPSNNNVVSFKHQNTAGNTIGNHTIIDHPLLNGKPNAVFVFSHNWNGVRIDKTLGAFYNGSNWAIYTEDMSAMPTDEVFNIVVMTTETTAAVGSNNLVDFNIYPNPVQDVLNIESQEEITKILIFNLLGQEVMSTRPASTSINLDVNNLNSGIYIIKLIANDKESSRKFIKK